MLLDISVQKVIRILLRADLNVQGAIHILRKPDFADPQSITARQSLGPYTKSIKNYKPNPRA